MEDLHLKIKKTAFELFKIYSLRPYQELIITKILEDDDTKILSVLPTGGGKSLCFLLPSVLKEEITIIVYPLLSLMHDQRDKLKKLNIPYSIMEGSLTRDEKNREIEKLEKGLSKILITNIEMLNVSWIFERLKLLSISLFVADEAHTIVSWGESFRSSYLSIGRIAKELKAKSILAFTATTDPIINEKIKKHLFCDEEYESVISSSDRVNIFYHVKTVLSARSEIKEIIQNKEYLPSIVFCRTRRETEELNALFCKDFNSKYYHAGLDTDKKKEIEEWFYKSDDGVLFATCAYGMGVDKKNIRSVVHHSLPSSSLDFLQESGRGGRDMLQSHSFTFIAPNEKSEIKDCFTNNKCIRKNLLSSLSQEMNNACSGCSVCDKEKIEYPVGYIYIINKLKFAPFLYTKNSFIKRLIVLKKKKTNPLYLFSNKEIEISINYLLDKKIILSVFNRLCARYSKKNNILR